MHKMSCISQVKWWEWWRPRMDNVGHSCKYSISVMISISQIRKWTRMLVNEHWRGNLARWSQAFRVWVGIVDRRDAESILNYFRIGSDGSWRVLWVIQYSLKYEQCTVWRRSRNFIGKSTESRFFRKTVNDLRSRIAHLNSKKALLELSALGSLEVSKARIGACRCVLYRYSLLNQYEYVLAR